MRLVNAQTQNKNPELLTYCPRIEKDRILFLNVFVQVRNFKNDGVPKFALL